MTAISYSQPWVLGPNASGRIMTIKVSGEDTLATLYTDTTGDTQAPNPFRIPVEGSIQWFADAGSYDMSVEIDGRRSTVKVVLAAGGGGGGGGTNHLKFPFAFDTDGLAAGADTGIHLSEGDLIYDAWIEIVTSWDGTTPFGDFGDFTGTDFGWIRWNKSALDMTLPAESAGNGDVAASFMPSQDFTLLQGQNAPLVVEDDIDILIVVSQTGLKGGDDPGSTVGAGILHLLVASAAGGEGGGVESVVAGDGISVDDTDPANPVVSVTGGGGGTTLQLSYNSVGPFTVPIMNLPEDWTGTGTLMAQLTTGDGLITGLLDHNGDEIPDGWTFPAMIFVEDGTIFDITALNAYVGNAYSGISQWSNEGGQPVFSIANATIVAPDMPTSDPGLAGEFWNSNGQVVLSGFEPGGNGLQAGDFAEVVVTLSIGPYTGGVGMQAQFNPLLSARTSDLVNQAAGFHMPVTGLPCVVGEGGSITGAGYPSVDIIGLDTTTDSLAITVTLFVTSLDGSEIIRIRTTETVDQAGPGQDFFADFSSPSVDVINGSDLSWVTDSGVVTAAGGTFVCLLQFDASWN